MTISLSLPMVPTRGTKSSLSTIVRCFKMSFDARGNRIPTLGFKLNRLLWKFSPKLGLAFLNWKIDRMKVQMMIKLTGKTNHGRNRIREHGDLWEVLEVPTGVIKMSHKPPFPPIKSVKTGAERWLDDQNFSWIPERFQLTISPAYAIMCIVRKQTRLI